MIFDLMVLKDRGSRGASASLALFPDDTLTIGIDVHAYLSPIGI